MHWQNQLFLTFESLTIHLVFLDSVKQCYLQTKKHALTLSERAHSITWYKQKRRRNRCHDDTLQLLNKILFTNLPVKPVRLREYQPL